MEHRIVRPDGTVRLVHDRAQPYFDSTGSLVRYVGATVDVTERRQAERRALEATEKLQQEKSKLEAAMESMSDCVFIADTSGRLTEIVSVLSPDRTGSGSLANAMLRVWPLVAGSDSPPCCAAEP